MISPGAWRSIARAASAAIFVGFAACDRKPAEVRVPPPTPPVTATPPPSANNPAPAAPHPGRVVAIGDLHGDLAVTRRALRLAGAIDSSDHWVGGALTVVQTGDSIDRADEDREVLDLLEKLTDEAKAKGGAMIALSGNHEIMNVELDFRYVTKRAFTSFSDVIGHPSLVAATLERGRTAAFAPGGPYARKLAKMPMYSKVGDSVFVHGGILPKHVAYGLPRMNDEVRAWMLGERPAPPQIVVSNDGPVWTRAYSTPGAPVVCTRVAEVLVSLGARRMVVGHTPQMEGITTACDDRVWRIDTGMSPYYGGPLEIIEITGEVVVVRNEAGVKRTARSTGGTEPSPAQQGASGLR